MTFSRAKVHLQLPLMFETRARYRKHVLSVVCMYPEFFASNQDFGHAHGLNERLNSRMDICVQFSIINPRRACAARVGLSVCLSVCLSVSQHLTSGASVRLENAVTYSTGDEGQKNMWVFFLKPLRCRDPALPPLYGHAYSRPFFHAYRVRACVLLVYIRA